MCIVIYVWMSGNTPKNLGTCSIKELNGEKNPYFLVLYVVSSFKNNFIIIQTYRMDAMQ